TMDEFYIDQAGNGYPFFAGLRYQRGHGWFGRLFKGGVLPLIRYVGKKALKLDQMYLKMFYKAADDAIDKIAQRGKGIKRKASDHHNLTVQRKKRRAGRPKKIGRHRNVPPAQMSIEKSVETENRPTSTLNATSFIEFDVPTTFDEYILLSETYLYMKVRLHLKKTTADKVTNADWSSVVPVNYLLHSLFKVVELSYNGKEITRVPQSYAYRAYKEALLGYSKEAKNTYLSSALWDKDDDKRSILFHSKGTDKEKGAIALLGGANLKLKLVLNPPKFFLNVPTGLQVQFEIIEASLFVHRLKATKSLIGAHKKALNIAPTKYPITRCELKHANVTKGVLDAMIDNVCFGILPRRIFVANGNVIFGFNFAPDLSNGSGNDGHVNIIKRGSLRLH
ncbi:uncharacterized protein B4U79_06148, partial [Dinothrombium tinctorium]